MKNRPRRPSRSPNRSSKNRPEWGRGLHHSALHFPEALVTRALFDRFEELVAAAPSSMFVRYVGLAESSFVVVFHGDANAFIAIADSFRAHVEQVYGSSDMVFPVTVTYIGENIDDWRGDYDEYTQSAKARWNAEVPNAA